MTTVDNAFGEPRLAALYDLAEGRRPDLVHYERMVRELGAASVLDVGCGTGTLACRLAASGIEVIGVDPAQASLDIARAKEHATRVQWIHGDATSLGEVSVDLALMTGNVAQVFLSDQDWLSTLSAIRTALRPNGHLVFEVRDPAYRGWEEWTPELTKRSAEVPGEGRVDTWCDLVEVALPLVSFRWTFQFHDVGVELHSNSTLRFRERDEVEQSLTEAGYLVREVRDAPDRPAKEFVFIAQPVS